MIQSAVNVQRASVTGAMTNMYPGTHTAPRRHYVAAQAEASPAQAGPIFLQASTPAPGLAYTACPVRYTATPAKSATITSARTGLQVVRRAAPAAAYASCTQTCAATASRHERESWAAAPAKYVDLPDGGKGLMILSRPVMEDWETPYMEALVSVACSSGGRVLEVGFGMAISAGFIDAHSSVTEHVIVEANREVVGEARSWADRAQRPTTVLDGFWQDVVTTLAPASFDGILFDVFPLNDKEASGLGEVEPFFEHAARLLRPGGKFTFYFNGGTNWTEGMQQFRSSAQPKLLKAGFDQVTDGEVHCKTRKICPYSYPKERFLVPCALK